MRAHGRLVADWAYPVPGHGLSGASRTASLVRASARARVSPRRKDERMAVEIGQEAPEAIDRQRLPRSSSDLAKNYFEELRKPEK